MTDAPNTESPRTDLSTTNDADHSELTPPEDGDTADSRGTTRRSVLRGIGATGLAAAIAPGIASAGHDAPVDADAYVDDKNGFLDAIDDGADVIWIDSDAIVDLTGQRDIELDDVTIVSGRGVDGPGAQIRCRSYPSRLFQTHGRVRLSGLRFRGPKTNYFDWPGYNSGRISCGVEIRGRAVIENCELLGWTNAAINVGSLDTDGWAHITDCDIHHCQMGGLGYGVNICEGEAWIDRCTFDATRHAIAGGGSGSAASCSYTAVNNFHGPQTILHGFDMHGDDDRVAGDRIVIRGNTFAFDHRNAVKIRGVPKNGCWIQQNEFSHRSKPRAPGGDRDAVRQIHFGRADPFEEINLWGNTYGGRKESGFAGAPRDVVDRYYSLFG